MTLATSNTALRAEVLQRILDEPLREGIDFAGFRNLSNTQVIRCKRLKINPLSITEIWITEAAPKFPFYVIAAKEITLEIPAIRDHTARFSFVSKVDGHLDGGPGTTGARGRSWNIDWSGDDGAPGGLGGDGGTGEAGWHVDLPQLFFLYDTLTIVGGTPQSPLGISFRLQGISAGNGGKGGRGGRGGDAARGTRAECTYETLLIPLPPVCNAGPGDGGDAGSKGRGGQGGNGGRGGNGGTILFFGPAGIGNAYHNIIEGNMERHQGPGAPGTRGGPGEIGEEGAPGGGGLIECCPHGGRTGDRSTTPEPQNFGFGSNGANGVEGQRYVVVRNNADVFPV